MTGAATTYALYALLLTGDGHATQRWIPPGGLTLEECAAQLEARQPTAEVRGAEAVQEVHGCEQEALNDPESAASVQKMFEAAQREDWQ
jgi:hypothetical protein